MPAKKKTVPAKANPHAGAQAALKALALGRDAGDMKDVLQTLVAYVDDVRERERPDPRDTAKDRLFAELMSRLDVLQEHRAAYLNLIARLRQNPPQLAALLPLMHQSMTASLHYAGLDVGGLRGATQAAGLMAVYAYALHAWEKDTKADLSYTMRALDKALGFAETAATWLGFAPPREL